MKQHLKKYRWLYILLGVMVIVPCVVWRMCQIPLFDRTTAMAVAQWVDDEYTRRFGLSQLEPYQKVYEQYIPDFQLTNDFRTRRMLDTMTWAPVLEPDFDAADEVYDPALEAFDEVTRQGGRLWVSQCEILKKLEQGGLSDTAPPVSDFLVHQNRCKLYRLRAERAMAQGQWERALEELEKAARVGNLCQQSLIGNLLSAATMSITYAGYERLLQNDAPLWVKRQAIEALRRYHATDPYFDDFLLLSERLTYYWQLMPAIRFKRSEPASSDLDRLLYFQSYAGRLLMLGDVYLAWIRQPAALTDPYLIRWARREKTISDWDENDHRFFLSANPHLTLTRVPMMVRFLCQAALDPGVRKSLPAPSQLWQNYDPWTLLMLASDRSGWDFNISGARTRDEVAHLKGWLAEAALRAQETYETTGHWPLEGIEWEDAASSPTVSANLGQSFAGETPPDLQIAWRTMAPDLAAALWGRSLPFLPRHQGNQNGPITPFNTMPSDDDSIGYMARYEILKPNADNNDLVEFVARGQVLQAHPKLVERVSMERSVPGDAQPYPNAMRVLGKQGIPAMPGVVTQQPQVPTGPLPSLNQTSWEPLDPAWARNMCDRQNERQWASLRAANQFLPPDQRDRPNAGPVTPPENIIIHIRLQADLKAPEQVLVIWHPGPDGKDDGGMIAYDPTNGTVSGGDLLVFPEGF